jgi:hypothetical protein
VLDQLRCITLDQWRGHAPPVLTESRSLAGVLRSVANEYRVCIAATNGQCGAFCAPESHPSCVRTTASSYLGDLDLEAAQIARLLAEEKA